jgi:hypothetical protein
MRSLRHIGLKLLALAVLASALTGCTRRFFRERADRDVEHLLAEKNQVEQWKIENWHVYPDARSRFADPSNPDRPPMPPDDPVARALSPNPQRPRRAGVALIEGTGYLDLLAAWDAMNRAEDKLETLPAPDPVPTVAKPAGVLPAQFCAPADDRVFRLKLEQACELGLINNPQYQDQRELLYESALPVSLQRFAFAAQFTSSGDVFRESTGADTPTGRTESWRADFNNGFTKLFPTGALLLFRLSNQVVVEMINGRANTSLGALTLELTQPLLRGGGLAVTLEPLTQAERNLLYAIRNYGRFRKNFYVAIASGADATSAQANSLAQSLGFSPGSVTANAGFLPMVQRRGQWDVDRLNVTALEGFVRRFEGFAEGGQVSQLQVDQVKQSLLRGRSSALSSELQYATTVDNFKRQLGMPPRVRIEPDMAALKPMTDQLDRFQQVLTEYEQAQDEAGKFPDPKDPKKFEPPGPGDTAKLRPRFRAQFQQDALTAGTKFRERIVARWSLWEKRTDDELGTAVLALRADRRRVLDEKAKLDADQKPVPDTLRQRLAEIEAELNLGEFESRLRAYEKQPWVGLGAEVREQRRLTMFRIAEGAFVLVLVEARNERIDMLHAVWPKLPPVTLDGADLLAAPLEESYTRASQAALTNRWDLMNARGQLVDSWRQIAVTANALLGTLDVQYHLDSTTPAGQNVPFGFSTSRSTQRFGLNWDLPLVRRLERNNYRVALINFQRQRRSLMATEDQILNDVRSEVRQLRVFAENYAIQQEQVALAYTQVESSLENFNQPAIPGVASGAGDAAALTQQLLQAQSSLNQAQGQLYSVWIGYINLRMQIYRDLELMPLDARGVWIDEYAPGNLSPGVQPAHHGPPAFSADLERHAPPGGGAPAGEIQWRASQAPQKVARP